MKKSIFFTLAVLFIVGVSASAQQPTFMKGDNIASIGIGLVKTGYYGYGYGYANSGRSSMPLIFASYERCIWDNMFNEQSSLGVGGIFGFSSTKYANLYKYSDIFVGVRGVFHYALVDKLDTYGGLGFGLAFSSFKYIDTSYKHSGSGSRFYPLFSVGARYYFSDAFAAFAELGYSYTVFNLGASFKF